MAHEIMQAYRNIDYNAFSVDPQAVMLLVWVVFDMCAVQSYVVVVLYSCKVSCMCLCQYESKCPSLLTSGNCVVVT